MKTKRQKKDCQETKRVVFFGSSHRSLYVLKTLHQHPQFFIAAVVSQPDKKVGRKKVLTPTPVSLFAKNLKIPLFLPKSNPQKPWLYQNPQKLTTAIKKLKPDILIVADYGQKIPQEILNLAPFEGINLHPSLLPKYRGASPVPWAIINGEDQTGITILKIAKDFDQGEIITWQQEKILPTDTAETLHERLFKKGAQLLLKILPLYLQGKIKLKKQESSKASYYPRLTRQDGFIKPLDLKKALEGKAKAEEIERKIRGLYPWPGTWTKIKLKTQNSKFKTQRLKILKAHLEGKKLVLERVQLEGKREVSFEQFKQAYSQDPVFFTRSSSGLSSGS